MALGHASVSDIFRETLTNRDGWLNEIAVPVRMDGDHVYCGTAEPVRLDGLRLLSTKWALDESRNGALSYQPAFASSNDEDLYEISQKNTFSQFKTYSAIGSEDAFDGRCTVALPLISLVKIIRIQEFVRRTIVDEQQYNPSPWYGQKSFTRDQLPIYLPDHRLIFSLKIMSESRFKECEWYSIPRKQKYIGRVDAKVYWGLYVRDWEYVEDGYRSIAVAEFWFDNVIMDIDDASTRFGWLFVEISCAIPLPVNIGARQCIWDWMSVPRNSKVIKRGTPWMHADQQLNPVTMSIHHHSVQEVEHGVIVCSDGVGLQIVITGDRRTLGRSSRLSIEPNPKDLHIRFSGTVS